MYAEAAPPTAAPDPAESPVWLDRRAEAALELAERTVRRTDLLTAIAELEGRAIGPDGRRASAWAHHHRGQAHLMSGATGNAIVELGEAFTQFNELGDGVGAGRACASLGVALHAAGNPHGAVDHLEAALDMQRSVGDTRGAVKTHQALGSVYAASRRTMEAEHALDRGRELAVEIGDVLLVADIDADIAHLANIRALEAAAEDDIDGARALFSSTVDRLTTLLGVIDEADTPALAGRISRVLGNALAGLDDHAAAIHHLREAARTADVAGDERTRMASDLDRARCLVASGRFEEARELLDEIASAATDEGGLGVRAEAMLLLADIHELMGDSAGAYRCFRAFHQLDVRRRDDDARAQVLAVATGLDLNRLRIEATAAQIEVDRLAAAAEDRSRFIAAVAHELRTPLTAVHGFAAALLAQWGELDQAEAREWMELIAEQANDASNIVEDLLTAAGVTRGTLQVIPTVIDVEETLGGEINGITLSVDERPPSACADSFRTRQIIRNLISNARRYGGRTIEVKLHAGDDRVLVDVIDDGDGVPEHDVETIFAHFGRSGAVGKVSTSMGLGLPVSRELARLMGGDLTYLRQDDRTVFRLALPAAVEEEDR